MLTLDFDAADAALEPIPGLDLLPEEVQRTVSEREEQHRAELAWAAAETRRLAAELQELKASKTEQVHFCTMFPTFYD